MSVSDYVSLVVIFFIFTATLWFAYAWYQDKNQSVHAILYNFPVLGRFRYFFEHLRPFFQQYFLNTDDDGVIERRKCDEVYRNSKNISNKISFGSSKKMKVGDIVFHNALIPLTKKKRSKRSVVIGENCETPFIVNNFFHISGMSFGALSAPAVKALSFGASKSGSWQNTGEGGLSEYHISENSNVIFQIGTANYGIRDTNGFICRDKLIKIGKRDEISAFEIKLSQGAKPGLGGILPGAKVSAQIASVRGIDEGKTSVSPPSNPEIKCIKDIAVLINKVRVLTGKPVGIKLAFTHNYTLVEILDACEEYNQENNNSVNGYPDFITIDGGDGGTGSAPVIFMESMALPLRFVLPGAVDLLKKRSLYNDIKIIASGKMISAADVSWALAVGATFVVSARGPMLAMGCIRAYQCGENTCPTGITTHDIKLQKGFDIGHKGQRVSNYITNIQKETVELANACGVEHPWDLTRKHASVIVDNHTAQILEDAYGKK
jgi:glutamate synthase domain-containing protein 2